MSEERKRILSLVENGTISAEEAIVLLEKLNAPKKDGEHAERPKVEVITPLKEEQEKQKKKTTGFEDLFGAFSSKETADKVEEIMDEFKKDLTEFGSRISTLLNTTISKVRGFESDTLFGEKIEFKNHYAFVADEVSAIEVDVPNGKVELYKSTEPVVSVDVTVKTTLVENEEHTKAEFLEDFIRHTDGKVKIHTSSKFSNVRLKIGIPEKELDVILVRSLNSNVSIDGANVKVMKVDLINGSVNVRNAEFDHADLSTKNGAIETRFVKGDDLEAETVNGRIYIEGCLKDVEAQSVNGHVVVTTTSEKSKKVKASTVAGAIELYVPKTVSIDGKLSTSFGKIDFGLNDVSEKSSEDSFLQKTMFFDKVIEDANVLKLSGESRTGSVIIRYNP